MQATKQVAKQAAGREAGGASKTNNITNGF
jgi:hypothetical protein